MKKQTVIFLGAILSIGFFLRLYKIDRPIADWHSWRQADTAAVTRQYAKEGINLLVPRYDDLSNIPSGMENPEGYRMVEFPLINGLTAFLFNSTNSFHNLSIETFMRFTSAVFSLGSIIFIFLLTKNLTNQKTALISALIFAILPFNLFYSTAILPEIPLVFFTLASTFFWIKYTQSSQLFFLASFIISSATAFLFKPLLIFLGPAYLYLLLKNKGFSVKNIFLFLMSLSLSAIPFLLWRQWISQFPSGIPAYTWLLNSTDIRFKGAFFRWLFAERIGKLILGYWGLIPFGIGIILKPVKKVGWFFHWWLAGLLAYLTVFATGNVTHDYYQIFIIPIIVTFTSLGINFLINVPKKYFNQFIVFCFLFIVLSFSWAFSWFHIRDFYNINNPAIVAAGRKADLILPPDAKVIAPYGGDTAFLYQTNRQGWPIGGQIEQRIDQGATHYITTTLDDEAQELMTKCQTLESNDQFTIISLKNCQIKHKLEI